MLKDGSWRTKRFRKYTISLRRHGSAQGRRHPYREFLDTVKIKLVSMGFREMRGALVETEFWNMDALFMPQFHPARDIHDVYFVKHPTYATQIAEPFLSQSREGSSKRRKHRVSGMAVRLRRRAGQAAGVEEPGYGGVC